MKIIFLGLIIFISIAAFYGIISPTSLIATYGILAILPLVLLYIRKNLFNTLFVLIFLSAIQGIGLIRIPVLPDIAPYRILLIVLLLFFVSELIMHKRKIIGGIKKVEIAMILLCVYILFSMIFAGTGYVKGKGLFLTFLLNAYVVPFLIYFFVKNLVTNEQEIRKIFIFFTIFGLYLGLTGIFEMFRLDFLVFPEYIMDHKIGIHWGRARGPFVQAGVNAMVISMIIFMSFYLLQLEKKKWAKFFIFVSLISMLVTLVLTYSRGSWLSFLLASLFVIRFFPSLRKAFIFFSVVVFLIIAVQISMNQFQIKHVQEGQQFFSRLTVEEAVTERLTSTTSIFSRINVYATAGRMFLAKPIFGFGYNKFKEEQSEYFVPIEGIPFNITEGISMHNMYGMILMEFGLIGLSLYLYILIYFIKINIKLYRLLPHEGFLSKNFMIIIGGVFIIYLTNMFTKDYQYIMFPNLYFYCVAGIMDGIYQRNMLKTSHEKIITA